MTKDAPKQGRTDKKDIREDRLKKALKANMAKRKAQARARRVDGPNGAQKHEQ